MSTKQSQMSRASSGWGVAGLLSSAALMLAVAPAAHATPELPSQYDARSLGMGGTGVAYTDNAAAVVVNPAGLSHVDRLTVTGVFAPFMPRSTVPFEDGAATDAERSFVPLFFAGGAYRFHDRVVGGLAAYAASGAGANFAPIPQFQDMRLDLTVAVLELALPVSVQITDELSVGAALRMAHAFVTMDIPVVMAEALPPARVEDSMSGTGFPGGTFGVQYRPLPFLAFGAAYRSKLSIDMDGSGKITADFLGGQQDVDVATRWSTAHQFRVGTEATFGDLKLAFDGTYTLLDDAIDTLPMQFTMQDGTEIGPEIQLQWKNSLAGFLGGEYTIVKLIPVRAGYALLQSGTPVEYADPRMPPPGLMHIATLGAGYRAGEFAVDLAGAYAVAGDDVVSTPNGAAGRYSGDFVIVSTSLSYRH